MSKLICVMRYEFKTGICKLEDIDEKTVEAKFNFNSTTNSLFQITLTDLETIRSPGEHYNSALAKV